MKELFYYQTIFLAFLLLLFSCDKETAVNLPEMGAVTYEVGYGEIAFNWSFPREQDVEYIRVDFMQGGEEKLYAFSRFSEKALITGLDALEYNFSIRTADKKGSLSAPVFVTATPMEPAYKIAAESLAVEPTIGGVIITWENPTGKDIQINLEYIDNKGILQYYSSISSDMKGAKYVLGVAEEEQTFSYYTSNPKNFLQISEIKTASIKPYVEVKFEDRSDWVVLDYSSMNSGDLPENLFDGNHGTIWQTDWRAGDPFPHYVVFDMGSNRIVTSLGFWNRDHNNANNAPTDLIVEGSLDGENWQVYGSYTDFPTTRGSEITYRLDSTPEIRYLRLTFDKGRNGTAYFALAEIYVYGAFL